MNPGDEGTKCAIRSIIHPSDNSEGSRRAFVHALKIALANRTHLTLAHVDTDPTVADKWWKAPAVRSILQDWALLERNVPRSAVFSELGVAVSKVVIPAKNPVQGILSYLDHASADLLVLATEGREGLPRWLQRSVAEPVARHARTSTLFVPKGSRDFVRPKDGKIILRRVLVPVDHDPDPQRAIDVTIGFMGSLRIIPRSIKMIYVGSRKNRPEIDVSERPRWPWEIAYRRGNVVNAIIRAAEKEDTDLIVMATQGHQGFLDALRGSTTEQVVRRAPCPLLAVPALC